jgi:hypothetical protein
LIGYVFSSGHCHRFGLQVAFLIFRPHWSSECNFAVLSDDFNVVGVGGKARIIMNRFSDFLGDCAVRRIDLLLVGGRACLILVLLGVVGRRLLVILIPRDWHGHQRCAESQRA